MSVASEILVEKSVKLEKTFSGHKNLHRYIGIHVVTF